ncbi:MAG: Fic family protein [Nanoarchaeota archaeon]
MYLYRKVSGDRITYYLRVSKRQGNKVVVKDIANLGTDPDKIMDNIGALDEKYSAQIRKSWRDLDRNVTIERFLKKARVSKLRQVKGLSKDDLVSVEACRLHFNDIFKKMDFKTREEFLDVFFSEYAWNTASIEGNTIPLKEAEKFFYENKASKNSSIEEVYDLRNNKEALKFIFENYDSLQISEGTMKKLHEILMRDVDKRLGFRTFDVRILNSRFKSSPYPYIGADVKDLLNWFNENENKLHPFVLAMIFHHRYEQIHPFADGNGRTGRLLINLILLKLGYMLLMIQRKNRTLYQDSLQKADSGFFKSETLDNYSELISYGVFELRQTYWKYFV